MGQAALIHLDGWTWEEMQVRGSAAMSLQFPVLASSSGFRFSRREGEPSTPFAEARRNYERRLQQLREFFEQARRYQKAKQAKAPGFEPDLKMEAMLPVLEGKLPVVARAVRERAIKEALAFAEKEKIRLVLAEATQAWKVAAELKAKNVAVVLGPVLGFHKPSKANQEAFERAVREIAESSDRLLRAIGESRHSQAEPLPQDPQLRR